MSKHRGKTTWETKFGRWLGLAILAFATLVGLHIWQDSLGEDAAWMWSCHTMGNHECGPGVPWLLIQIGGTD